MVRESPRPLSFSFLLTDCVAFHCSLAPSMLQTGKQMYPGSNYASGSRDEVRGGEPLITALIKF